MTPYLTVFIPAYNEANCLENTVNSLLTKFKQAGIPAELFIVNDASSDDTGKIADACAERSREVRVWHHPTNKGIGGGFLTACQHARGEWMILIPADLALEVNQIDRYLEAANQADIVVGLRSDRSDYSLLRHLVSWTNIHLIQILFRMSLRQYQYISMYRMQVLRTIQIEYWRSAFFLAEILIKARDRGFKLVEVDILYTPRLTGKPTGAKLRLVLHTVYDIFHYWLRWRLHQRTISSIPTN